MGSGRLKDWQWRLNAVIRRWMGMEYGWQANCAHFAGDCVEAVTGIDPIADIRDAIGCARGWSGVLRKHGGFEAAIAARLGAPISDSRPGDILMTDESMKGLGVSIGHAGLFLGDVGLRRIPLDQCVRIFRNG